MLYGATARELALNVGHTKEWGENSNTAIERKQGERT